MAETTRSARPCRRLPWYDGDAAGALAGAEALLDGLATMGASNPAAPALRWSLLAQPALYLGASQKPEAADLAACRAAGVAVYKRAAGGNAVLAGPDLLGLDLALPDGDPLLLHDLTQSYRWLGEVWTTALHGLGVDAALVSIEQARANQRDMSAGVRLARLACFGALSPFEVTVGGRKVMGLAQVRRRHGALFQAALLLRWRPQQVSEMLAAPANERGFPVAPTVSSDEQVAHRQPAAAAGARAALTAALAARAVGLDAVAPRPLTRDAIIAAVEAALADYGLIPGDASWTPTEQELTARLVGARYQRLEVA